MTAAEPGDWDAFVVVVVVVAADWVLAEAVAENGELAAEASVVREEDRAERDRVVAASDDSD